MLAEQIDQVLSVPRLDDLIAIYFDSAATNAFAGTTFDALGSNPADRFVVDDIVAASLLDVHFGPPAVRRLIEIAEFDDDLAALDNAQQIWDTDVDLIKRLNELRLRLQALPGVGVTKASKLLARKRPALAPIQDSVVRQVLGLEPDMGWRGFVAELAVALGSETRRRALESVRPPQAQISHLRVLDVSLWMLGSKSRNAQAARLSVGLSKQPWRLHA